MTGLDIICVDPLVSGVRG